MSLVYLFALLLMSAGLTHASSRKPSCKNQFLDQEFDYSRKELSSMERLQAVRSVQKDVAKLIELLAKPRELNPEESAVYSQCLDRKKRIFQKHLELAGSVLHGTPEFNLIAGKYAFSFRLWKQANVYFREYSRMKPDAYHGLWWELRAWHEEIKSANSPLSKETYFRQLKSRLEPIIALDSTPKNIKIDGLHQLATASLMIQKRDEAVGFSKRLLKVDPLHENSIYFLIQESISTAPPGDTLKFVEKHMAALRSPAPGRENLLERVLEMSTQYRHDFDTRPLAQRALMIYPNNKMFKKFSQDRMPASK